MTTPAAAQSAAMFPAPIFVTVGGETVEIKPCGIAQSIRIRDMGQPILDREFGVRSFDLWVAEEPAECNALLCVATGLDPTWVNALGEDDRLELAKSVYELNADFFVRVRVGQWARTVRMVSKALSGLGLMSSTDSSLPGTQIPEATPARKPNNSSKPSTAPNGASAASA